MLRHYRWAWAGLVAAMLASPAAADPKTDASEPASCGEYGTSLHFEKTPSDAANKAIKQEKLVFVLHVSGNFEDSEFT